MNDSLRNSKDKSCYHEFSIITTDSESLCAKCGITMTELIRQCELMRNVGVFGGIVDSSGPLHSKHRDNDKVNYPYHYTVGGIETMDYIEAKLTNTEYCGFLRGSILQYISRAPYKGSELEDLKKAEVLIKNLIQKLEQKKLDDFTPPATANSEVNG